MVCQKLGRHRLLVNGSIQQRIIGQGERVSAARKMDCFGGPAAQIDGDNLIAPLGLAANKWQTHIGPVEQEKCQGCRVDDGQSPMSLWPGNYQ